MVRRPISLLLLLLLPSALAQAGKFAWFDDSLESDSPLLNYRSSTSGNEAYTKMTFGEDRFQAFSRELSEDAELAGEPHAVAPGRPADVFHVYGGFTFARDPVVAAPPGRLLPETAQAGGSNRLSALGAKWLHRLSPDNEMAFAAGYSEFTPTNLPGQLMMDTRATVSWTSRWGGGWSPRLTGSFFLGDEAARDEAYRHLGRRYYGVAVGGNVTVFDRHTPYITYRLQRSQLEDADLTLYPYERADEHSLISAGWKWQATRNLSLQAEATYSLSDTGLDLYNPDRSRVFFGTRFDFR